MKSVWMREKCMAVARLSGLLLFNLLYTETNEGGGEHAPNVQDTPQIEQDHKKYPTVEGCLSTPNKVTRSFPSLS